MSKSRQLKIWAIIVSFFFQEGKKIDMYLRKYGRPSSTTEEEIHFKPMLAYHFVAKTSYKKAFKSTLTMDDAPYGYYVVNPEG
jgi:hypothetical protein